MPNKRKNIKRSNVQKNLQVADLSPHLVKLPNDPPPTEYSIKITKRIELIVSNNEGDVVNIAPAVLAGGIPGGQTYWTSLRIEKLSFWAPSTAQKGIRLTIQPNKDWGQPGRFFQDNGVEGSQRPRLGIKLGLLDRARWYNTAATDIICSVSTVEPHLPITVQATVEFMSSA